MLFLTNEKHQFILQFNTCQHQQFITCHLTHRVCVISCENWTDHERWKKYRRSRQRKSASAHWWEKKEREAWQRSKMELWSFQRWWIPSQYHWQVVYKRLCVFFSCSGIFYWKLMKFNRNYRFFVDVLLLRLVLDKSLRSKVFIDSAPINPLPFLIE